MPFRRPVTELIQTRFSCRTYLNTPLEEAVRQQLVAFTAAARTGPLGTPVRFQLVAATAEDRTALKGLGTYGFICGATGFVLGAVQGGEKNMEDLGHWMERIILFATDLGLGTCWLGGTFSRSSFAAKMSLHEGELLVCVAAVGYISEKRRLMDRAIRRGAGSANRFPWEHMFFDTRFGTPLSPQTAGAYAVPLEMVCLGPSASNKQPWRIVKAGAAWHFYLQRTAGYGHRRAPGLQIADLQRVDMGIAMSHFELTAQEVRLAGHWVIQEPGIEKPDNSTEYIVSWMEGVAGSQQ